MLAFSTPSILVILTTKRLETTSAVYSRLQVKLYVNMPYLHRTHKLSKKWYLGFLHHVLQFSKIFFLISNLCMFWADGESIDNSVDELTNGIYSFVTSLKRFINRLISEIFLNFWNEWKSNLNSSDGRVSKIIWYQSWTNFLGKSAF